MISDSDCGSSRSRHRFIPLPFPVHFSQMTFRIYGCTQQNCLCIRWMKMRQQSRWAISANWAINNAPFSYFGNLFRCEQSGINQLVRIEIFKQCDVDNGEIPARITKVDVLVSGKFQPEWGLVSFVLMNNVRQRFRSNLIVCLLRKKHQKLRKVDLRKLTISKKIQRV